MRILTLALLAHAAGASSVSYLAKMADSFMSHGVNKVSGYGEATLYKGFEEAYRVTGNKAIIPWYKNQLDGSVVLENGTIVGWKDGFFSLDAYRIGNCFLWWYERTGEAKYKTAARTIRSHMDRHPRTPSGGFWHRDPSYPNQMWLDGIFMADSFYARWTAAFDARNRSAWDDVALQYDLIEAHTRNKTTGLLVHGYDESKVAVWADPVTGAAPLVWGRALGWYFLSLTEVIPLFPTWHPARARLTRYFISIAAALKKTQDSSGGWWLVMNDPYPGMKGNYIESSESAMFTYGFLIGMRLGLLDKREYLRPARKAYNCLTSRFITENADGTINWEGTVKVGSLGSNGTFEVSSHPAQLSEARS
jgi:rhamnogalacturonyl hydrolase YesR